MRLIATSVLSAVCFCGCSLATKPTAPGGFQVDIKNASTSFMDQSEIRASNAMHSFLLGQLAYVKEDMDGALQNFVRAGEFSDAPNPLLNARLAELYVASSDYSKALVEIDKATAADPEDVDSLLLKAALLDATGKHQATPAIFEQAYQAEPRRLDVAVLLANSYQERHMQERALEILNAFVKAVPQDALGWYFLGRAYEKLSQFSRASSSFDEAQKREPQNLTISLEALRVLLKQKKLKESRELVSQISKKDPQNPLLVKLSSELSGSDQSVQDSLEQLSFATQVSDDPADLRFRLAQTAIERRDFSVAMLHLRSVLTAQPHNTQARYYLGSIYAGSGRKKEAIAELYKISKDQDLYVKSRTFAAFILRQDGDLQRAENAVREALEVETGNRNILSYLILILRDEKKFVEAEQLMRGSIADDPGNDKLLFNYGILLHDMGREAESRKSMERVLEINPKHTDALNFLAYGLADSEADLPRALELIQRALEVRPNDGYYLDTLGWVYFKQGNFADAEEALSRAASVVTEDLLIQEHYGDALVKVGKIDQAASVYRNALERGRDLNNKDETEALIRIEKKLDEISGAHPPHLSSASR